MHMEPEQETENRSARSGASKRKKRKEQLDEWNGRHGMYYTIGRWSGNILAIVPSRAKLNLIPYLRFVCELHIPMAEGVACVDGNGS